MSNIPGNEVKAIEALFKEHFNKGREEGKREAIEEVEREVIGEDELRVERKKDGLEYLISGAITRNNLRSEQREKLSVLKDKYGK